MTGIVSGLDLAVPTVFDAGLIARAVPSLEELSGRIRDQAASDPALSTLLRDATAARAEFLTLAAALAASAYEPKEVLLEKLHRYSRGALQVGPFAVSAPAIVGYLKEAIAAEGGDPAELQTLAGWPESPAAHEIHSLYGVAVEISREPAARQLVLDLSANRAYRELQEGFPALHEMAARHLERYGWVRTVAGLDPLSPKELLQRIQVALLRWDPKTIGLAAGEDEKDTREPSKHQELVDAYRTVAGDVAFGPQLFVMARWLARPFFDSLAAALEVETPLLPFATPGEISRALSGDAPLPTGELLGRRREGFIVNRSGDETTVSTGAPGTEDLGGQSVSLGRAVGRVKVILDADEGGKLRVGDILVTNLSTPTYEGEPSVFPYRTVAAVAVDRAGAIVTDEGGLLSHAAIICRENQVPSILGTDRATEVLRDGMIVEVDATRAAGRVTILQP